MQLSIKRTINIRTITVDVRKAICLNILLIAFFDSFPVYSSILGVKVFIYGLKLLNLLAFFILMLKNSKANYLWALCTFPVWWAYINEGSLLISFQLLYSGLIPVLVFILLKDEEKYYIAQWYINIFVFLLGVGIPIYLLINFLNISPLFSIQRGEGGGARIYDNYLLLYWTRAGVENRFSSVFDEPGVVGTIVPLIIFYYRQTLTTLKFWILSIAGLLSFSLFFLILFAPVLYFANARVLRKRQLFVKIFFSVIFIMFTYVAFVFIARSTKDHPILSLKVYHRFKWENNWIIGIVNNRDQNIRGFNSSYEDFSQSGGTDLYVGRGKDYVQKVYGGSTLSYRVFILERGLLILVYLAILFASFHQWRKYFIFSLISLTILALVFFQRPMLYSINYFVLVFVGVHLYRFQHTDNKKVKG